MNNTVLPQEGEAPNILIRAANVMIAITREHGGHKARLDLETNLGETWRITIECIKRGDEQ